ncbi:hypothetical protein ACN28S_62365 [Cystobacter fuscus]
MTLPPAQGLADTLMRSPSSTQVPTVGASPESLQLQGPSRKGWLVAISSRRSVWLEPRRVSPPS